VLPEAFGQRRWGITVRDRTDDRLIIWEHDLSKEDLIHVRYLGSDPLA